MGIVELALRRAGAESLSAFQAGQGLAQTGELDAGTREALEPYLVGYRVVRVRAGDTVAGLAAQYGTTPAAIAAANPALDPQALPAGRLVTVPLGFPVVPVDIPFTSRVLRLCIRGLTARYPALQEMTLTRTRNGRAVPLLQFGRGARTVFYNAAHHANEWITTPVLMKFLEDYCAAAAAGGTIWQQAAARLARQTTLVLAPMVNPDGVDLVTGAIAPGSGEYRAAQQLAGAYPDIPFPEGWKANLAGTDLNLNYPAGWEQAREIKFTQGYTQPGPRDYVGSAPLSEPETAAMAAYTQALAPELILAYHTQGEVIYWQFQDYAPPGAQELGERFAESSGYALELTPQESGYAGYKDWFLQEFRRPGYTIECGLGENPLPLSQFDAIYAANLGILVQGLMG